jgi:ACS family glucarate transporter-like MFS transporter
MSPAAARPTSVRWRILALLMLLSGVAYILRINVSIAAPSIKTDLGLSEVQLGLVLSSFVFLYAVGQIPGGLLGEWFGGRKVMTWLVLGWGVTTIAVGLVPGRDRAPLWLILGVLVLLRALLGAFQAPLFPVTSGKTIVRWFPASRWAFANAMETVAYTLASAAAGPLWVWLILQFGWRTAIMISGPVAIVLAVAWWWYVRDDPRDHAGVGAAELALIESNRPAPSSVSAETGWRIVLRNRDVVLLTASYFCINYVFYLFFSWFYYYLTEVRGISEQLAGVFTGAQWAVAAVAGATGGILCDALIARYGATTGCRLTAMGGILLATPCLVLGAVTAEPLAAVALLSVSFASTQLVDSVYWVAAMRVAGPRASLATGVLNTGGNLSGSVAGVLVPIVAEGWGWAAGVGSGVVFALAAAVLWLWIRAE